MANIVKWNLPCYKMGPGGKIISLGMSTLHVDFDRKRYQIEFADGTTVKGMILTYYSGGSYQAWGMIDLGTQTDVYMFGTNSAFYPGYLTYTYLGNNGLVWLPQSSGIGPVIKASDTGFSATNLPTGQKVSAICYLPGTMIATQQGERAIETLRPGDTLIAWTDGIAQQKTIISPCMTIAQDIPSVSSKARLATERPIAICSLRQSIVCISMDALSRRACSSTARQFFTIKRSSPMIIII